MEPAASCLRRHPQRRRVREPPAASATQATGHGHRPVVVRRSVGAAAPAAASTSNSRFATHHRDGRLCARTTARQNTRVLPSADLRAHRTQAFGARLRRAAQGHERHRRVVSRRVPVPPARPEKPPSFVGDKVYLSVSVASKLWLSNAR